MNEQERGGHNRPVASEGADSGAVVDLSPLDSVMSFALAALAVDADALAELIDDWRSRAANTDEPGRTRALTSLDEYERLGRLAVDTQSAMAGIIDRWTAAGLIDPF